MRECTVSVASPHRDYNLLLCASSSYSICYLFGINLAIVEKMKINLLDYVAVLLGFGYKKPY